jgi:hypothetical protein
VLQLHSDRGLESESPASTANYDPDNSQGGEAEGILCGRARRTLQTGIGEGARFDAETRLEGVTSAAQRLI